MRFEVRRKRMCHCQCPTAPPPSVGVKCTARSFTSTLRSTNTQESPIWHDARIVQLTKAQSTKKCTKHHHKDTVRLGKAKFELIQSTLIKPKLCGLQGLYERGAHTKFQLPTCKWTRETLGWKLGYFCPKPVLGN